MPSDDNTGEDDPLLMELQGNPIFFGIDDLFWRDGPLFKPPTIAFPLRPAPCFPYVVRWGRLVWKTILRELLKPYVDRPSIIHRVFEFDCETERNTPFLPETQNFLDYACWLIESDEEN